MATTPEGRTLRPRDPHLLIYENKGCECQRGVRSKERSFGGLSDLMLRICSASIEPFQLQVRARHVVSSDVHSYDALIVSASQSCLLHGLFGSRGLSSTAVTVYHYSMVF